jgi:hypothetical protein
MTLPSPPMRSRSCRYTPGGAEQQTHHARALPRRGSRASLGPSWRSGANRDTLDPCMSPVAQPMSCGSVVDEVRTQ